jgi:integrase
VIYHVYQSTVEGEKRWGCYYRIGKHKKTAIADPRTKKPFASQVDVESWIRELRSQEETAAVTLAEVGTHLFEPDGEWAKRRARRLNKKSLSEGTLYEHAMIVRKYINPWIGQEPVVDVDFQVVDDWIYEVDVSNSFRRNLISTLRLVLKEAVRRRILKAVPYTELPGKGGRKPSTLTLAEIDLLFPEDLEKLHHVWKDRYDKADEGLAFAACCASMFFAGLRPQEARAASVDQVLTDIWAILVIRSMNRHGTAQSYMKMANARDPRYRGIFLFLQGPTIMKAWLDVRPPESGFLFSFHGEAILKDRLQDRLQAAIVRAGIPTEGRRFVPYSGRYTFETTVKTALPREALMLFMGHIDEAMPEHYDVPVLVDRMHVMAEYREDANKRPKNGSRILPFPAPSQGRVASDAK